MYERSLSEPPIAHNSSQPRLALYSHHLRVFGVHLVFNMHTDTFNAI